jgi:hypothetical protein
MGFGGLLKKVAAEGASAALEGAAQSASGGVSGLTIGAVEMAVKKDERVGQIASLVGAASSDKIAAVAELLDDVASLGRLVKEARVDDEITPDELNMILAAVEELEQDARGALSQLS